MHDALPDLARRLRDAARVVFFTGAGVSAESGIPTFRDAQTGLWARYSPEELASPEGFRADSRTVWEWYAWRREKCLAAEPNPAHLAIAALERRLPGVTLITQNVDGLHQRAGSPAPLELHGNLHRLKCFRCEADGGDWPATLDSLPHCACGGLLRPAVVWFGENLPSDVLARASEAGLQAGCSSASALPAWSIRPPSCRFRPSAVAPSWSRSIRSRRRSAGMPTSACTARPAASCQSCWPRWRAERRLSQHERIS